MRTADEVRAFLACNTRSQHDNLRARRRALHARHWRAGPALGHVCRAQVPAAEAVGGQHNRGVRRGAGLRAAAVWLAGRRVRLDDQPRGALCGGHSGERPRDEPHAARAVARAAPRGDRHHERSVRPRRRGAGHCGHGARAATGGQRALRTRARAHGGRLGHRNAHLAVTGRPRVRPAARLRLGFRYLRHSDLSVQPPPFPH